MAVFFVLKDHGVVDLNQRGSCSTRRRGRRKYAGEGLAHRQNKGQRIKIIKKYYHQNTKLKIN